MWQKSQNTGLSFFFFSCVEEETKLGILSQAIQHKYAFEWKLSGKALRQSDSAEQLVK